MTNLLYQPTKLTVTSGVLTISQNIHPNLTLKELFFLYCLDELISGTDSFRNYNYMYIRMLQYYVICQP